MSNTTTIVTGATVQATATAVDLVTGAPVDVAFSWTSDNASIASVDASGLVTAGTTAGTANITATASANGFTRSGSGVATVTQADTGDFSVTVDFAS